LGHGGIAELFAPHVALKAALLKPDHRINAGSDRKMQFTA
jgi:hypothetical protein